MSERDFDHDPEVLAWARGHVEEFIRRMGTFEQQAAEKGDPVTRLGCGVTALMARQHFLGTEKIIGVFDERRIGDAE